MSPSTDSHIYRLLPKAPLVFRTGRPFGETGGGDTYPFPLPSTLAGALRTAWAEQQPGRFNYRDEQRQAELLTKPVHGPLLARIEGERLTALLPRPADALYLAADDGTVRAYRLAPQLVDGAGCDLPHPDLLPVLLDEAAPAGKPPSDLPVFWTADIMNRWLHGAKLPPDPTQHGVGALPVEHRTHVALADDTFAADPGALFQSGGLDFAMRRKPQVGDLASRGWHDEEFALLVRTGFSVAPTLRRVGGEGRFARIEPATGWPALPAKLAQTIADEKQKRLRLVLATPALFKDGWRPGWINADTLEGSPPDHDDLRLRLRACACERWQALSGWDLVAHKPRAVRRLVPAGAVYWFEILQGDADAIARLWLAPLADRKQDRLDGFGLALPGLWIDNK